MKHLYALTAALFAEAALPSMAQAQEIVLRYATAAPATQYLEAQGGKKFIDRVVELTKGKVKFEYYPAGQLGKADKMTDLVSSGAVDIAAIGSAYVTNTMPMVGLFELPGIYINACAISDLYRKVLIEGTAFYDTDMSNKNYRFLFSAGPANNEISGKGTPVSSPEGFQGKKIRAAGGVIASVVTALGGAPVRISSPETYEAYSRGTVDAILVPWPSFIDYDLDSLSTYTTHGLGFGAGLYLWEINKASWDKLPDDVKQAIDQASLETEQGLCKWTEQYIVDATAKLTAQGITIVEIDQEKRAKFEEVLAPFVKDWAKALDGRGLPGSKALDEFQAALKTVSTN